MVYPTVPTPPEPFFLSLNLTVLTWSSLSLLSFPSPSLTLSLSLRDHVSAKKKNKRKKLGLRSCRGWKMKVTPWLRTKSTPRLEASSPDLIVFFYYGCWIWWFLVLWLLDLVRSRWIWWDLTGSRKKMGLCLCLGLLCLWFEFWYQIFDNFVCVCDWVWYNFVVL